jgi:NAD(P)-dependent dehydrogenase (short-subunit alcohol dehydrogenase family)
VNPPSADLFDLSGKVALVTGGSRGLGREMVLGFAHAGADVVITSRKIGACGAVADEVRSATGRDALPFACHVGRWDQLPGLVEAAYDRFGRIDVLVNNAGMSPLYGDVAEVDERLFDSVVNLNLKGPFRLTALVGTRMAADGGGTVINVSSTGSIRPDPWMIPYSAAKAGLNALTEAFAHTFGPTVRVNTLMAGPFLTDVSEAWDMDAFAEGAKRFALQRAGRPEEVVGTALYLASPASSFTTGACIRVDGGIP